MSINLLLNRHDFGFTEFLITECHSCCEMVDCLRPLLLQILDLVARPAKITFRGVGLDLDIGFVSDLEASS